MSPKYVGTTWYVVFPDMKQVMTVKVIDVTATTTLFEIRGQALEAFDPNSGKRQVRYVSEDVRWIERITG